MHQKHEGPAHPRQGANRATYHSRQTNYSPSPAENLLSRLDDVRQTGDNRLVARCPAHADRNPSLGIRECGDGTLLIRCWAGCSADSVVRAVGLELRDLFPQHMDGRSFEPTAPRPKRPRFQARELLQLAALEARIVSLAAFAVAKGQALPTDDLVRVGQAATTLSALAKEASNHV